MSTLIKYTKARFVVAIRDNPEIFTIQNDKALSKISLPQITTKSPAEKENILSKFRIKIIEEIRKVNTILDYKNLVREEERTIITQEEER